MCNFPFRCEAFGNVQFSLWCVKPFLQIMCEACPSRGQLGFFERSVAYVQRNGVTFEHKGQLSFFERSTTSLKDTLHILKQYCFCCLTRLQLENTIHIVKD